MSVDIPWSVYSATKRGNLKWRNNTAKAGESKFCIGTDDNERPCLTVYSGDTSRDYYGERVNELLDLVEDQSFAADTSILDDLGGL